MSTDKVATGEAVRFLAGLTGLADDEGATAVAAELGYLRPALALAAAVIVAQQLEYPAYLESLRMTAGAEDPLPYPPGAVKAALLSLEAIWAADRPRVGTRMIAIMAVLSASGVRRELLHAAGQAGVLAVGGRQVTAAAVDDAVVDLAGRRLLAPAADGQVIVMHRLVAGAARSRLAGNGELTEAAQAAATALEAQARSLDADRKRPAVSDFAEQVAALARHADGPAGQSQPGWGLTSSLLRLRFLALYYLIELGDSAAEAVAVGESLTADLERVLGPDHPDTQNVRNSLAAAYLAAGRAAEAVPLFERILAGRERALGPDHPYTLSSRNNLAVAYQDDGRVGEAIRQLRLTLAAREGLLGADHPDTLNSRGNLAAAYRAAGQAAEAIALLEQTLAGRKRVLGSGHPDTRAAQDHLDEARREASQPSTAVPVSAAESTAAIVIPEEPVAEETPAEALVPEESVAEEPGVSEPEAGAPRELVPLPVPAPAVPRPRPVPEPGRPSAGRPARKPVRLPLVAAAVLVLIVASGVIGALTRPHSGDHSPDSAKATRSKPANAAQMAADWVAHQVSRSVTVACDPLMCAALEARGVPAARLLVLRTGSANPRGAGVVVATPAVRDQFGSRLDSEYAPSVIAGFGSGAGQVDVQVVAPAGVAAYRAELRQDQAARKAAGTQLLANKRIGLTAQAHEQLADGSVDSRVLILLPALAATHPVQVLAFGNPGPGAGPDSPLCAVSLSGSGRAAAMADADYQRWLTSFVRAQLDHFTGNVTVAGRGDRLVVRVEFAHPSPLGLLSG